MLRPTLNLGILAHIDAGKTSLTERLLFDRGAITELGSVDAGNTTTDTSELERQRGITIRSAVASFTIEQADRDLQINLVDTPGHPDFIAEVERALSVLDAAVLVISAVEGVQAQTRVLMRSLRDLRLPTVLFINKIDRVGAQYATLLASIRAMLAPGIIPLSTIQDAGTPAAQSLPRSLSDGDVALDVAEVLADGDDVMLAGLVDGAAPAIEQLETSMIEQVAHGQVHPVFFGSAITGAGIEALTGGIGWLLGPLASKPAAPTGGEAPQGTVFAIDRARSGEKFAYIRLFGGALTERQQVGFWRSAPDRRVAEFTGRITALQVCGAPDEHRLTAGGIGIVRGLSQVRVGDQLGAGSPRGKRHFSRPGLESVVHAVVPGDAGRLHAALRGLAEQDPFIQARSIPGGATSVLLYGEVQREVIQARLEQDFQLRAEFEPVRPVYTERPVGRGEALQAFDKRGENRFWATIGLRVEPAEIGSGNSFARDVEWGSVPRAFHTATEEAVMQALQHGLYGWEMIDCLVTLTQLGYEAPVSVAADFRGLAPVVLLSALQRAGSQVYEPCHRIEVEVPPGTVSAVLSRLTSLRAEIVQTEERKGAWLITAELPVRSMHAFTLALPGLSHGEGAVWTRPGADRAVPGTAVPNRGAGDLRHRWP